MRLYLAMMSVAVYPSGWPTCRPDPLHNKTCMCSLVYNMLFVVSEVHFDVNDARGHELNAKLFDEQLLQRHRHDWVYLGYGNMSRA